MQPSMLSPKASRCFGTSAPLVQKGSLVLLTRRARLVAMLLAGCWLQNGAEPSFCGKVAEDIRLQLPSCGATIPQRGRIPRRVRERRRQVPDRTSDGEARRLTAQISSTDSATELLALLEKPVENKNLFNHFHMSAAMTTLARFKKRRQLRPADASSSVWAQLAARLSEMLVQDALAPRGIANVFYAVGELYEQMGEHTSQVLPKLCEAVQAKAAGMVEQALSNCLLAAAKLQGSAPEALKVVPTLTRYIQGKAVSMNSQDLGNCLWAAARLQDASPEVLDAVPALAKRIADKAQDMIPQDLSNCLIAAAKLQDASPEVLDCVPALAKRIPEQVQHMNPQDLSNCLWASETLQDASPEVLDAVPALAKRIPDKVLHMVPQGQSNCLLAAAKLQDSAPEALEAVPAVVRRMQETIIAMNLQDLSNNFRAVAMLRDASSDVLALAPELIRRIHPVIRQLSPEGLQMSLQAAQQLGEDELRDSLQAEIDRRQR
ncbi:unnamed protein product [Symbiodinium sp. CCMP2592]|nr:unnamed protein product [Symbiodinium sp. CCMP2592]